MGGVGGWGRGIWWGWGVRLDVNVEVKFLVFMKIQKKLGGGGWWGGLRVDVSAMLGEGGDVGYGGVN